MGDELLSKCELCGTKCKYTYPLYGKHICSKCHKENYSPKTVRYFINDYFKTKSCLHDLHGEVKCFICSYDLNLDIHHIYSYKKDYYPKDAVSQILNNQPKDKRGAFKYVKNQCEKLIFLCPNHHHFFHRLVASKWSDTNFYLKNYPKNLFDLDLIRMRINELEKENEPYYSGEYEEFKNIDITGKWAKDYNKNPDKKEYEQIRFLPNKKFIGKNSVCIKKSELINKKIESPKCYICGYVMVLDVHHLNKEKKSIFLCPNHHHMIHRHLKDINGDKLTLKEIKGGIEKIEKDKIPFYREVTSEKYNKY